MTSSSLFVFSELLGAIRIKSGALLAVVVLLIFSFLALFSSFFLLGTPMEGEREQTLAPEEIMVHLSPRLSQEAAQELYSRIREWQDVQQINYLFAQELEADQVGGVLLIRAVSQSVVASLLKLLESTNDVLRVDSPGSSRRRALSLSTSVQIGLLIGLAVSALASLVAARRGFKELLYDFADEIRLMRLSGTSEQTIQPPIIALGIVCGLLAGLLLVVVVYLLHYFAVSQPQALLRAASGLIEAGRVRTVSLLSLLLGFIMGGLVGTLGASLTGSREFQTYS